MLSSLVTGMLMLRILPHFIRIERWNALNGVQLILLYLPYLDLGYRTAINRKLLGGVAPDYRMQLIRFGQSLYLRISLLLLPGLLVAMAIYSQLPAVRVAKQGILYFLSLGVGGTLATMAFAQVNLLLGLGEQKKVFQINTVYTWGNLAVIWGALQAGMGLWAIPISMAGMTIVQMGLAWYFCRRLVPGFRLLGSMHPEDFWPIFREMRSEAVACFRSQIAILLLFTVDPLLAGNIGESHAAAEAGGRYATAARMFAQLRSLLQAGSEAAWPLIAQQQNKSAKGNPGDKIMALTQWLVRVNAWVYGAAMGPVIMVLVPFAAWWTQNKTASWTPGQTLVTLMSLRFLIAGISSPSAFFLIGSGQFGTLARYIEREIVLGVVLSFLLAPRFHGEGVAAAFLIATVCGTFTPLFWAWANGAGLNARSWYLTTLARSLVSVGAGTGGAWLGIQIWGSGWGTIPAGGMGCIFAAMAAMAWTFRKPVRPGAGLLGRFWRLENL